MIKNSALIVENDAALAHVFAEALQFVGLPTETIHDGKTALTRLAETTPGLVILDLDIPNDTGIDLLQYVGDQVHLHGVAIIVVTRDPRLGKRLEGTVKLVLVKPITYAQMAKFAALIATL